MRGIRPGKALTILQTSRRFQILFAVLLPLGWTGIAAAEPARPAAVVVAATPAPSNSVACVYDHMSPEDREMALLLFEREVAVTVKFRFGSRNLSVIGRLVNAARDRCAAAYAWPRGQSDAAISYAMNELMSSGLAQALEAKGHAAALIDEYYAKHRSEFAGIETVTGPNSAALQGYLTEHGWDKTEPTALGIAGFYLEALLTRERQARKFTAAAATAKPNRRPFRAKSARRGKP